MKISDEAVEAAAKAQYERRTLRPWDSIKPIYRHNWLADARAAIEATAPYIRAEALEEAADELADLESLNTSGAISEWLRARAAEMRQG